VSSQILVIMSRHNMTDILLAATGICAFAIVLRDPGLERKRSFAGFMLAAALGILAKSIAGLLVLAVVGIVAVGTRRGVRRVGLASAAAIALASPWFLYNLVLHREWFLADMGFQLITIGTAVHQTSQENHLWFYVRRILTSDLLPLVLALSGLPALVRAVRRRDAAGWLAASYAAVYFAALMIFRFHSEQYLTWFAPSLILIAGLYSPWLTGRSGAVLIAVIALVFAGKVLNPETDFGIAMQPGTTLAAAPVLKDYCEQHRAADLYILGVDDEFYSAVLPLPRVRYGWIDATNLVQKEHPHLGFLGILIPAREFPELKQRLPVYRERLRSWGLPSTRPLATGLTSPDAAGLLQILHDHPESDFLVSRTILPEPERATGHRVVVSNGEFALLESKMPAGEATAEWSCRM